MCVLGSRLRTTSGIVFQLTLWLLQPITLLVIAIEVKLILNRIPEFLAYAAVQFHEPAPEVV